MIILRYLGRQTYKALGAIVMVLVLMLNINQLASLLNKSAQGQFTPGVVLQAVALGLPLFLTYIVPLALLLGVTVVLGRMTADHELVTMRACGYSQRQLFWSMVAVSMPVLLLVSGLTFYLAPLSEKLERTLLAYAVLTASLNKVLPGQFQEFGDKGAVFFADRVDENHKMRDVFFMLPMKPGANNKNLAPKWDVVRARSVTELKPAVGDPFMVFHNGRKLVMQPGNLSANVFYYKDYGLRLAMPTDVKVRKPYRTMPMGQLWQVRNKSSFYQAELQWRFAIPISVLVITLLAVPLSRVNPRQGKFMRVIPAVLFYALYANLLSCSRSWLESGQIPPWVGLWWVPTLSLMLLGGWSLLRVLKQRAQRRSYVVD